MRLMHVEPSAFLVCEKSLDAETLLIRAARLLSGVPMTDYLQGLLISLGPTTQHHHWAIGAPGDLHFLSLDEGPRLAPRSQGIQAKGLACPRRHGALGRAARLAPARIIARLRQRGSIELAVAPKHHWGALGEAGSPQCHQRDVQVLGKRPLGAWPHAPRQRQGTPFLEHVDHPRHAATAHDTTIHHAHACLEGYMRQ